MRGESMKGKSKKSTYSTTFGVDPKSTYSTTFGVDPKKSTYSTTFGVDPKKPQSREWLRVLNGGADEVRTHDL